jgi:hypothetical protein
MSMRLGMTLEGALSMDEKGRQGQRLDALTL